MTLTIFEVTKRTFEGYRHYLAITNINAETSITVHNRKLTDSIDESVNRNLVIDYQDIFRGLLSGCAHAVSIIKQQPSLAFFRVFIYHRLISAE